MRIYHKFFKYSYIFIGGIIIASLGVANDYINNRKKIYDMNSHIITSIEKLNFFERANKCDGSKFRLLQYYVAIILFQIYYCINLLFFGYIYDTKFLDLQYRIETNEKIKNEQNDDINYYISKLRQYIFSFVYYDIFQNKDVFGNLNFLEKELINYNKIHQLTDYQKTLLIKKNVTKHIKYNSSNLYFTNIFPPSLIAERCECACLGFSTLTSQLLNTIGIKSDLRILSEQNHAMVEVCIDGKKYIIEPQDPRNILYEKYDFWDNLKKFFN